MLPGPFYFKITAHKCSPTQGHLGIYFTLCKKTKMSVRTLLRVQSTADGDLQSLNGLMGGNGSTGWRAANAQRARGVHWPVACSALNKQRKHRKRLQHVRCASQRGLSVFWSVSEQRGCVCACGGESRNRQSHTRLTFANLELLSAKRLASRDSWEKRCSSWLRVPESEEASDQRGWAPACWSLHNERHCVFSVKILRLDPDWL